MVDETGEDRRGGGAPHLFVVELHHDGRTVYALCERTMLIDGPDAIPGFPREAFEAFLRDHALRAIAIPTLDPCGPKTLARTIGQSGFNVTINVGGN
jgi:hypothetical protein